MSESAASWIEALAALPNIHTTDIADTGSYTYRYASLPSILEIVRPVLADQGWAVTQDVTTADNGNPQVTTRFFHSSGDEQVFGPLAMPGGNNAQAIGSAITYARRYALISALGLAPDGDDDGAAATTPEPAAKPELTPDEIADHLTNAAKADLYGRIHVDGVTIKEAKGLASETWPLILKDADLVEIRTEADRDKALAAIKERYTNPDERPFE